MSKYLFPDFETYNALDIRRVSMDRYARHSSLRVLMCAFAFDDGPVEIWQEGETGLEGLKRDLRTYVVVPWHTTFERNISQYGLGVTDVKWRDCMIASLYAGFPAGLKDCVKLPFFKGEAESTKEALLINKFCKPQANGTVRNRETDPEDWALFCDYCKRDVQGTRVVWQWIQSRIPTPERIWREWEIDQRINQRGTPMDRRLTERGWTEAQRLQAREAQRLKELTGLDNPNSGAQLLQWLKPEGYPYTSLGKELVLKALKEDPDGDEDLDNLD